MVNLVKGLAGLAILALVASALSNLGLPTRSQVVDHLGDAEKARLSELFHRKSGRKPPPSGVRRNAARRSGCVTRSFVL